MQNFVRTNYIYMHITDSLTTVRLAQPFLLLRDIFVFLFKLDFDIKWEKSKINHCFKDKTQIAAFFIAV